MGSFLGPSGPRGARLLGFPDTSSIPTIEPDHHQPSPVLVTSTKAIGFGFFSITTTIRRGGGLWGDWTVRKRLVCTDHHNDEAFLDLSRDARLIFGHLITHPQTMSFGLIRCTVGGLADECGMSRSECEAALGELAGIGYLEVGKRCIALSEDYLEAPANPSVVASWGKFINLLPRSELVRRRLRRAFVLVKKKAAASENGDAWRDAVPTAMRDMLAEGSRPPARFTPLPEVVPIDQARRQTVSQSNGLPVTVESNRSPGDPVGQDAGDGAEQGAGDGSEDPVEPPAYAPASSDVEDDAHGGPQGALDPHLQGVEHGVGQGVEHGVGHPAGHSVEHGAGHGVPHSIFHLPTSSIQLPDSRRACSSAGARGDDPDGDDAKFRALVDLARVTLGRQLEVVEVRMIESWVDAGVPQGLIETAMADGRRKGIRRLEWVRRRLGTLFEGHVYQNPDLAEDDVESERRAALASLDDDGISGHLSLEGRKGAKRSIERATSAREVRDLLDDALEGATIEDPETNTAQVA